MTISGKKAEFEVIFKFLIFWLRAISAPDLTALIAKENIFDWEPWHWNTSWTAFLDLKLWNCKSDTWQSVGGCYGNHWVLYGEPGNEINIKTNCGPRFFWGFEHNGRFQEYRFRLYIFYRRLLNISHSGNEPVRWGRPKNLIQRRANWIFHSMSLKIEIKTDVSDGNILTVRWQHFKESNTLHFPSVPSVHVQTFPTRQEPIAWMWY